MLRPFMTHRAPAMVAMIAVCIAACGSEVGPTADARPAGQSVTVTVNPQTATVPTQGKAMFAATTAGTSVLTVTWSVKEGTGCGSVSATGLYSAPASAATCTVVATSTADTSVSGLATVTVTIPSPVDRSIVPADRRIAWDPGIRSSDTLPYGWVRGVDNLPDSSKMTVCKTAVDTFGNGTSDATKYLQGLLDACPPGQVVKLPAGRWRVAVGGLVVPAGVVLKGAGAGQTYVLQDYSASATYPDGVILCGSENTWGLSYDVHTITSDVHRGDMTIVVDSGAAFHAGEIVMIDQEDVTNPANALHLYIDQSRVDPIGSRSGTDPTYSSGTPRTYKALVEVASVSGNVLTLKDGVTGDFQVAQRAQIVRGLRGGGGPFWDYAKWVGIEGLTASGSVGRGGNIGFPRCAYSWAKNVESNGLLQSGSALNHGGVFGIVLDGSYRCTIRDSYIHDTRHYMNNHDSYGMVLINTTTNSLIENNIVMRFDKPIQFQSTGGGNVIGYNYADVSIDLTNSGTGGAWQGHAWTDNTIGFHLQTPHHELIEGNYAPQIGPDADHGTTLLLTVFRNWITSQNPSPLNWTADNAPLPNTIADLNNVAIRWAENQFYGTTIGNVLLMPTTMKSRIYEYSADYTNDNGNVAYNLSGETKDTRVKATFHRHMDFDYATRAVYRNPANAVTTMPNSLYLASKPSFFGTATWPWVDPNGATDADRVKVLPAKARFDAGKPNDTTPP